MTKTQAISLFVAVKDLAEALNITPSAVYQWPDKLPQRLADEIVGAALRCNRITPEQAAERFCDPVVTSPSRSPADPDAASRAPTLARLAGGGNHVDGSAA
ncbi:MAG TPA: hypothetical protein DDW89_04930 [Gammaproteobacteria bacterium]|nr:hypothetical protein [Gammaproteobacteria bacterium]